MSCLSPTPHFWTRAAWARSVVIGGKALVFVALGWNAVVVVCAGRWSITVYCAAGFFLFFVDKMVYFVCVWGFSCMLFRS